MNIKNKEMKNIKKHIMRIVLVLFLGMMTSALMADPPDPDGPGSGGGGVLPGGGAPIGGGSIIFIALATAYGLKKTYTLSIIKDSE